MGGLSPIQKIVSECDFPGKCFQYNHWRGKFRNLPISVIKEHLHPLTEEYSGDLVIGFKEKSMDTPESILVLGWYLVQSCFAGLQEAAGVVAQPAGVIRLTNLELGIHHSPSRSDVCQWESKWCGDGWGPAKKEGTEAGSQTARL